MIYKTKQNYYTIENRLDTLKKIKHRGYKIAIDNFIFYVEDDKQFCKLRVTESETGLKVYEVFATEDNTLQSIEQHLINEKEKIKKEILTWKSQHPGVVLQNLEESE